MSDLAQSFTLVSQIPGHRFDQSRNQISPTLEVALGLRPSLKDLFFSRHQRVVHPAPQQERDDQQQADSQYGRKRSIHFALPSSLVESFGDILNHLRGATAGGQNNNGDDRRCRDERQHDTPHSGSCRMRRHDRGGTTAGKTVVEHLSLLLAEQAFIGHSPDASLRLHLPSP